MDLALFVARLALAAVFFVAGVAKLADQAGTRKAVTEFGLPQALAQPVAFLLPLAELTVALLLLPAATAWLGAIGAAALLLLFLTVIGLNLARGKKPDCHCFGQIYSEPIGWATVLRNTLFAALAFFVVGWGRLAAGPSAFDWLASLTVSEKVILGGGLFLFLLIVVQAALILDLMRQSGRILLQLEAMEEGYARLTAGASLPAAPAQSSGPRYGLPVGSLAPAFSLSGLYGETLTLDALRAPGKPVLLISTDPNCGPCGHLIPQVARWQREHHGAVTVALLSRGAPEANRAKAAEHGVTLMLLQKDRDVAAAYQIVATPSAVLVRPDGTIGSDVAAGSDAIQRLVAQIAGVPQYPAVPGVAGSGSNGHHGTNGSPALADGAGHAPGQNGAGDGHPVPAQPPQPAMAPAPAAPALGTAAPPVKLPDLGGKLVELASLRGSKAVLLFWNPQCGFCTRMVEDLKTWEAQKGKGAARLVLISTGEAEANRAMGLNSTVLLEPGFNAGRHFGATGTPSAVLIDEKGRIASELAVGGPAVMDLLQAHSGKSQPEGTPPGVRARAAA